MDGLIADVAIQSIKWVSAIGGGTIAGAYLKHWLGKTKEEADIILTWEEIHAARDKKLLDEIKRLEEKLDEYILVMEEERNTHRREVMLWEESDSKKDCIIKEKIKIIAMQEQELEKLR